MGASQELSGQDINMFSPEFPKKEVRDNRATFEAQLGKLTSEIDALQNPEAQEILRGILDLFANIDKRVRPAEEFVADDRELKARELDTEQRRFSRENHKIFEGPHDNTRILSR